METAITAFDLKIRYQIYRFIAERCRVPTDQEIASLLNVAKDEVRSSFHRLHARHMIFLEPGGDTIRMANPFSAVPTRYKVRSEKKQWWANCAWDAFGIAAAFHTDVDIEASNKKCLPGKFCRLSRFGSCLNSGIETASPLILQADPSQKRTRYLNSWVCELNFGDLMVWRKRNT